MFINRGDGWGQMAGGPAQDLHRGPMLLCNTMGQGCLSSLALLAIERTLVKSLKRQLVGMTGNRAFP